VVAAAKELSGNNGAEVVIKIQPGKLADMILSDGDPTKEIRDIDKITTVIRAVKFTIRSQLRNPSE
jgi:imidazolonepropionase-like amidohydrolase